jgi:hypothetical protein
VARIETIRLNPTTSLVPEYAIVVHVASFRFGFGSLEQLKACIDYFSCKTHPSSRVAAKKLAADLGEDWRELRGWEVERWFERLPMYLLEEPKRQKVLKALLDALELAEKERLLPSRPKPQYSPLVKR